MDMMPDKWPDNGGPPCCGGEALLPLAWLAARTWLAAGRCFWRQRDHTPIWPKQ